MASGHFSLKYIIRYGAYGSKKFMRSYGHITLPPSISPSRKRIYFGLRPWYLVAVQIGTPNWKHTKFNEEENKTKLRCVADLIKKIREIAHIREFDAK